MLGVWCNGSMKLSKSFHLGSSPSTPAYAKVPAGKPEAIPYNIVIYWTYRLKVINYTHKRLSLCRKTRWGFLMYNWPMNDCILFVDGENFLHKIREVLKNKNLNKNKFNLAQIDLNQLLTNPLKNLKVNRKIFYVSRLHFHSESKEKSFELLKFQRSLRNTLTSQGFEFVFSGNVRAQKVGSKVIFREKGVDVQIAVDMVALSCDKKMTTAILCSSDSDLQPAVKESRARGVDIVYLGFENSPNKGLSYTTNRTILIRNSEVIEVFNK